MSIREVSAVISAVAILIGTAWYVRLVLEGKITPVLTSWIVINGTMTLSFATYWTSPNHSLVSNAANAASVLSTWANFSAILVVAIRQKEKIKFSSFQKWCLWISGAIALVWVIIVWGLHGTGIVPNVMTQILMLIGYLVTAEKLWGATKNSESKFTWGSIAIGSAAGIVTSVISHDNLALIYALRATIAATTIVCLMYRIELKKVP